MRNISTPLHDRALEIKIDTIESSINTMSKLVPVSGEVMKAIVNEFCEFLPPVETESLDTSLHMIHGFNPGGIGGAKSTKSGNIFFTWKKLFIDSAGSILALAGATAYPFLIPLAALVIWRQLWSRMNIELSERHAALIWSLWKNCNQNYSIKVEDLQEILNRDLAKYDRPRVNSTELSSLIEDLEKMGCINVRHDVIWLRENVRLDYK